MKYPQLLIASTNPAKIKRRKKSLWWFFDVVWPQDVWMDKTSVEEWMTSLIDNSQKKALIFAKESWILSMWDDTWFYIKELWWEPWIAVRRRWWELPDDTNDEDYLEFFKQKVKNLKDTSAYFEYAISLATPDGKTKTTTHQSHGTIDLYKLDKIDQSQKWYPLSICHCKNGKSRSDMTDEERSQNDQELANKIIDMYKQYFGKKI